MQCALQYGRKHRSYHRRTGLCIAMKEAYLAISACWSLEILLHPLFRSDNCDPLDCMHDAAICSLCRQLWVWQRSIKSCIVLAKECRSSIPYTLWEVELCTYVVRHGSSSIYTERLHSKVYFMHPTNPVHFTQKLTI